MVSDSFEYDFDPVDYGGFSQFEARMQMKFFEVEVYNRSGRLERKEIQPHPMFPDLPESGYLIFGENTFMTSDDGKRCYFLEGNEWRLN
jgi:hypothetical protein